MPGRDARRRGRARNTFEITTRVAGRVVGRSLNFPGCAIPSLVTRCRIPALLSAAAVRCSPAPSDRHHEPADQWFAVQQHQHRASRGPVTLVNLTPIKTMNCPHGLEHHAWRQSSGVRRAAAQRELFEYGPSLLFGSLDCCLTGAQDCIKALGSRRKFNESLRGEEMMADLTPEPMLRIAIVFLWPQKSTSPPNAR